MSQDPFSSVQVINPFEPDREVSPDRFAGRIAEIRALGELFTLLVSGRGARHIALKGERGIGKTSLMRYVEQNISRYTAFQPGGGLTAPEVIYVSLGSCSTSNDVCKLILDSIRLRTPSSWFSAARRKIKEELDTFQVGVPGILSVTTKNARAAEASLPPLFPRLLSELSAERALVLVLDETDRLGEIEDFPNIFKYTVEEMRRLKCERVSFVLTAVPVVWDKLCIYESFSRMFLNILSMSPLTEVESFNFLSKALEQGIPLKRMSDEFKSKIYEYSEGVPTFLQHIAYFSFYVDVDNILDLQDLELALHGDGEQRGALAMLEEKFFKKLYIDVVRSNTYREILRVMSRHSEEVVSLEFIKGELADNPTKGLSTYMSNMVKRGVILKLEGVDGSYKLPSKTFKIFLQLKDQEISERG